MGVDRIQFFNVTEQAQHLNYKREHPLSDLIREDYRWHLGGKPDFDLAADFDSPLEVLALWLSSDGDDTKSKFSVDLNHLTLVLNGNKAEKQSGKK